MSDNEDHSDAENGHEEANGDNDESADIEIDECADVEDCSENVHDDSEVVKSEENSEKVNGDDKKKDRKSKRSKSLSRSRSRSSSRSRRHKKKSKRHQSSSRSNSSRSRSRSRGHKRRRSRSRSRSGGRDYSSRGGGFGRNGRYDVDDPPPSKCLGVFGLSLYTDEKTVKRFFAKFGKVEDVQIIYDRKTNRSRGFAFVYFDSVEDATCARDASLSEEIDGQRIRVDFSVTKRPHTPTPGIYYGRPTFSGSNSSSRGGRQRSRSYSPRRY